MANIDGTSGDNVLFGTPENDRIKGFEGNDNLFGVGGDDVLIGGPGNDYLDGGDGSDILKGGSGNDNFRIMPQASESPNDIIDGGSGTDTLYLYLSGSSLASTLSIADHAVAQPFDGGSVVNIERLYFVGGSGDDDVTGGQLDDLIVGGGGNAVLNGGGGNDFVAGYDGFDRLAGGSGDDEISISLTNSEHYGVVVDGGSGTDTFRITAGVGAPLNFDYGTFSHSPGINVSNVEIVEFGGSYYGDVITGGELQDYIYGIDGNDVLSGGAGNDQLEGDSGNDTIDGGAGNDSISGGTGKDILTGGTGADTFIFSIDFDTGVPDSRVGGGVRDVITDFQPGEDKIDVSQLGLDFAHLSFKEVGSGLIVYGDVNGNGHDQGDFAVQLTGVHSVSASDFIFG